MCTIVLTAYKSGCKTVGGAKKIVIADKAVVDASETAFAFEDGTLTITPDAEPPTACELIPRQGNINYTQPITDDNTQGTSFITQTIEFSLHAYKAALAALGDNLRKGRFYVFILGENDLWYAFGINDRGMESNGGDAGFSGTALGDANGSTFTLVSESTMAAPEVGEDQITAAFTITEPS